MRANERQRKTTWKLKRNADGLNAHVDALYIRRDGTHSQHIRFFHPRDTSPQVASNNGNQTQLLSWSRTCTPNKKAGEGGGETLAPRCRRDGKRKKHYHQCTAVSSHQRTKCPVPDVSGGTKKKLAHRHKNPKTEPPRIQNTKSVLSHLSLTLSSNARPFRATNPTILSTTTRFASSGTADSHTSAFRPSTTVSPASPSLRSHPPTAARGSVTRDAPSLRSRGEALLLVVALMPAATVVASATRPRSSSSSPEESYAPPRRLGPPSELSDCSAGGGRGGNVPAAAAHRGGKRVAGRGKDGKNRTIVEREGEEKRNGSRADGGGGERGKGGR